MRPFIIYLNTYNWVSYLEHNVGDLVWIMGNELNGFVSGYGLVVERKVVKLDDACMVDVFVLHNGDVYRPLRVSKLGVALYGEARKEST